MRRKIYTVDEEMNGTAFQLLFMLIWYLGIFRMILGSGFTPGFLIFLLGGLMIPYQVFRRIQKALYHRKLHAQIMQESAPQQGRIVNVTREYYLDENSSSRNRRQITYYYLMIEVVDAYTGVMQTIKSDPYRLPVYRYLASPLVQVYTDRSGWKHVIDGFQLKRSKNEPNIPLENPNLYMKDFQQAPMFMRVINTAILILMLMMILGVIK